MTVSLCLCCRREASVRELLERHLQVDRTDQSRERESFLLDKLHVPAAWIHQAKVLQNNPTEKRFA